MDSYLFMHKIFMQSFQENNMDSYIFQAQDSYAIFQENNMVTCHFMHKIHMKYFSRK